MKDQSTKMINLNFNAKTVAFYIFALLSVLYVIYQVASQFMEPDFYVYAAIGRNFWAHGESLLKDTNSIYFSGMPYNSPWLYMLILGFFDFHWGYAGDTFVKILLHLGPLLLILREIKKRLNDFGGWDAAFLIITIAMATVFHTQLRPNSICMLLGAYFTIACMRVHANDSMKLLGWLLFLFVFWIQIHAYAAAIGYCAVCALILSKLLSPVPTRLKAYYCLYGLAFLLAGFIHPFPQPFHPIESIVHIGPNVSNLYLEESSEEWNPALVFQSMAQVLFWLTALASLVYAIIKKNMYQLLLISVIIAYGTTTVAMYQPSFFILMPIMIHQYVDIKASPLRMRILKAVPTLILILMAFAAIKTELWRQESPYTGKSLLKTDQYALEYLYPIELVKYMNQKNLGGNLFNYMDVGTYLMYSLTTPHKVLIDIRTNLVYPVNFFKAYYNSSRSPNMMNVVIEKQDIKHLIGKNDAPENIAAAAAALQRVNVEFIDSNYTLFSVDKGYQQMTRLMDDPACLKDTQLSELEAELSQLRTQPIVSKPLENLYTIAIQYLRDPNFDFAPDKIGSLAPQSKWARDLLGQISEWQNNPKAAFFYYSSKKDMNPAVLARVIELSIQTKNQHQLGAILETIADWSKFEEANGGTVFYQTFSYDKRKLETLRAALIDASASGLSKSHDVENIIRNMDKWIIMTDSINAKNEAPSSIYRKRCTNSL